MGITVTGGEGGIRARLDDLAAMSRLLAEASSTVTEAANAAAFGRLEIGGCSGLDLGPHNAALSDLLASLASPSAAARDAADDLRGLSRLMTFIAVTYGDTDLNLAHLFTSSLFALPKALLEGSITFLTTGNPIRAGERALTADPELADTIAKLASSDVLAAASSAYVTDGHAVVVDDCNDLSPVAVDAPRGVSDLIDELALRNDGASGEVSVSFIVGSDGTRRAIVDIPGTKSWTPAHTSDVTSLATNLRAINGASTTYEQGVLDAMHRAGVTADEPVMLVGHSEGGMIAVNAARDALAGGQFRVTHVVTAGAPIGRTVGDLPPSVSVLALEGRHDLVPHLDGTSNPDAPNVTTVTGGKDFGDIADNHSLDASYDPLARSVDASHNGSVRAFLSGAHGFLGGSSMTTEKYVITREY